MLRDSLSYFFLKKLIISNRSASLIRRISLLSFIAITLSVAIFFLVLFVMNGMNHNIKNRILALDPHLNIIKKEKALDDLPSTNDMSVIPYESYDLMLRTVDGQFRGTSAVGYDQAGISFWFKQLKDLKVNNQDSRFVFYDPSLDVDLELQANEIAVGIDLARSLGLLEGDVVTLIPAESLLLSSMEAPVFEKATIRRIVTTDLYDLDSKLLFFNKDLSIKSLRQSPSKTSGYHIWLKDINQMEPLRASLEAKGFEHVESWQQKNSDLFFALFMEKTMIGIFLGLAGLIASSSILTVLALVMSQKKLDIAIIKTLGYSSKNTLLLFLMMGLWISLSGLFLGTFIGVAVGYYLQYYPLNILPAVYYDSSIPALVNPVFTFWVVLGVTALAIVGCYIPARASLKIEPAILLKSKH
ncbi:ABC transporter permease [Bdellovibrio sp. qaytius]|nr:ABC transporter permease [Bdellovibrio sp. qaytius]